MFLTRPVSLPPTGDGQPWTRTPTSSWKNIASGSACFRRIRQCHTYCPIWRGGVGHTPTIWRRSMFASQESRVIAEPRLAAVSEAGQAPTARVRSWLLPSLSDVLFFVLLSILFMSGSGWSELLADSDTGWHIRTGEYILRAHTVP